jgi:SIR2-like protein
VILSGPQFAERFALNPTQYCWLLGSGASASAGIPTGYTMIIDFKKRLFCQQSSTPFREVDANDPIWVGRIDQFFRARSMLPPAGHPTEYARAFEAVYRTAEERRQYIAQAIQKGTPSFGHRVLASLLTTKRMPCIFTTNFDPLIENATTLTDTFVVAADRANMAVAGIDSAARAARCIAESTWPLLAKLHGDFQSVELKNTTDELKAQDVQMRATLQSACGRFGIVIVGYSGRDESVMDALIEACFQPNFPGGIYWVTSAPDKVLPAVKTLFDQARATGVDAAFVQSENFDEHMADIAERIDLPPALKNHVYEARPEPTLVRVPVPTHEAQNFPVLQCSAVPILELPATARLIRVSKSITTSELRERLKKNEVYATVSSLGREIAAFGKDADLLQVLDGFDPKIEGQIALDLEAHSWALGLVYDALARAISNRRPLIPVFRRSGHFIFAGQGKPDESEGTAAWRKAGLATLRTAYSPAALFGVVPKAELPFSEAIRLRLERTAGRWWCVFEPSTYIHRPRKQKEDDEADDQPDDENDFTRVDNPIIDWTRERWARRYNEPWARIISAWADTISGHSTIASYGIDPEDGVDAIFLLSAITGWSRPANDHPYLRR